MNYSADIQRLKRNYLAEDFKITTWEHLKPFFEELLNRELLSKEHLEKWLRDISELDAAISEDACWRQIRMTCDTENKELEEAYVFFMTKIQPGIQPYADKLNRKLLDHPLTKELDQEKFHTYLRTIKKNIDLFRKENIPIQAELNVMQQQFGNISGKMTINVDGKEYTLPQATRFLESKDRKLRESVYRKIQERRLQDKEDLNSLYSQLVKKRHAVALNAGFRNYRDYRFMELGRFDYDKQDCFQFHESVKQHIMPLVDMIYKRKKERLGVDPFRPWDLEASPEEETPLIPFSDTEELIEKSIACFDMLSPFFGDCLRKMKALRHLDLESRKGKAPGGYNCPLAEIGAPFIFMNAAGQMDDLITMVHEGGHAVHSFLAHNLELSAFKEYPMEIAEVASMAMELFTMDYWDIFFNSEEELKRAKIHQLERVITIFPWIATVDKFQHWVYENPDHSETQRLQQWEKIMNEFTSSEIDYSGLEEYRRYFWQKQLHLYEVPFYYIEYGIAQLGAIGLWIQFRENKRAALENYINALARGGTQTLPELFRTAGLSFDFSAGTVDRLTSFVHSELKKLS